jgi:hypothetical protein
MKKIGHWSWTLSADERKTAVVFAIRQDGQIRLTTKLRRKHEAMLLKQRKLDHFEEQREREGVAPIGRSRPSFRRSLTAQSEGHIFASGDARHGTAGLDLRQGH